MIIRLGIAFIVCALWCHKVEAQRGYEKDSIQIKVYTTLVINKELAVDTIKVRKVFCDYCSDIQREKIGQQSVYVTESMRFEPRYYKKGQHRITLSLRIPRKQFNALDENQ